MCFFAHTAGRVPDNVHFLLDDAAEEDWLYPLESFDFIHTRTMLGSFEDFRDIIKRSLKYTKPGGWMESQVRLGLLTFPFPFPFPSPFTFPRPASPLVWGTVQGPRGLTMR